MTRRFLDDVRADLNAQLVTGGKTTANELRPLLIDMIDSTIEDECQISSIQQTNSISTTTAWTKINTNVFGASFGGDGVFLKPDFANGEIVANAVSGYKYSIDASISFEGKKNDRYDFIILHDGVPFGTIAIQTGEGANDPITAQPSALILSTASNAAFSVAVRSPGGPSSIDIISAVVNVVIKPTNNP